MNNPQIKSELITWKKKYAKLVKAFEQSRDAWQETEKILCRTTIRLTLAAHGLNSSLDPHLQKIRDLLKNELNYNTAPLNELDALSEALLRIEQLGARENELNLKSAEFLFDFLLRFSVGPDERQHLESIRDSVARGEYSKPAALYSDISAALKARSHLAETAPAPKFTLLGHSTSSPSNLLDSRIIREHLLAILNGIEIPPPLADTANELIARLQDTEGTEPLLPLLEDSIDLLMNIKAVLDQEQKELENFLAQLSTRLRDLEQEALDAGNSQREASDHRLADNTTMADQLETLKAASREATELNQLKINISRRLETLCLQIGEHQKKEKEHRQQTEQQLVELTNRIQIMELESRELHSKLRLAHHKALRDALTGIPNRMAYEERLPQEIARRRRFGQPLSMVIWDIDHFKSINDRFGHSAGDQVLQVIGKRLVTSIRETDFVCRYGGEEFLMLLVGASAGEALSAAEKIRQKIEQTGFNSQGKPIPITASCGISEFGEADDSAERVFARADGALYAAKNGGRNCCMVR